jgi:putative aldouronate transport system substrate-binding protein
MNEGVMRMNTKRMVVALTLSAGLVAVGVGCQSQSAEKAADGKEVSKEKKTLKWIVNIGPEIVLKDNPILQKAEELSGYKLEIEAPAQKTYNDRINLLVASKDLPDVYWFGTAGDYERTAKDGVVAVLDDKIKSYPNLMKNITEAQFGDTRAYATGKIQAIPRPNSYDRWGYVINQKWLDKLGLKAPTTIEEFEQVALAFANNDPDGNGVKDTFGFSVRDNLINLKSDFISTAFNLSNHPGMPAADGKYYTEENSPAYLAYLDLLRRLYANGALDNEFITRAVNTDLDQLFAQGKVGMIGYSGKNFVEIAGKYNVKLEDYTYHAPLALNGRKPVYMMPPSNYGAWHIPAASKNIDDVLRFLDWGNSEEGFKLFNYGVEGVHYNKVDLATRTVDRTPEQFELYKKHSSSALAIADALGGRPPIEGGANEAERAKWKKEFEAAEQVTDKYYVPFVKPYYDMNAKITTLTRQSQTMENRYVSGQISKEELVNFIKKEWTANPEIVNGEAAMNEWMSKYPLEIKK